MIRHQLKKLTRCQMGGYRMPSVVRIAKNEIPLPVTRLPQKLTKGADITLGTDCFTLIKSPTGWKIMSLVFYND
jgi:hypothetical protein